MLSRYDRPPWKLVNEKQFDVKLSAFGPGTSSDSYRTETARTVDEEYENTSRYIRPDRRWETK
jgi:hypothetical protein